MPISTLPTNEMIRLDSLLWKSCALFVTWMIYMLSIQYHKIHFKIILACKSLKHNLHLGHFNIDWLLLPLYLAQYVTSH